MFKQKCLILLKPKALVCHQAIYRNLIFQNRHSQYQPPVLGDTFYMYEINRAQQQVEFLK